MRDSPPVLLIVLLVFLLGAASSLGAFAWRTVEWYDARYDWQDEEYTKLTQLHSDLTLDRFQEVLGAPWFRDESSHHGWIEYSFRGRGYWVQAVTRHNSDTVSLYAVTSCSASFAPAFRLVDATPIQLTRSTLASIKPPYFDHFSADYFFPAATANMHFMEWIYGGNPGNYKTFVWGYNDACGRAPVLEDPFGALGIDGKYEGAIEDLPQPLKSLRERTTVNTFAEAGPSEWNVLERIPFQVGVDRILVRTVTTPYIQPAEENG